MIDSLRTLALIAATLTTGLIAGLFFAYACSVMPGLRRVDDRAFVGSMQQINIAILNGWFLLTFMGAPVITAVAGGLHVSHTWRSALPAIVAGFVLYLVQLIATFAVNVPLNDQLEVAGRGDQIADIAAVRARFETVWVRWNLVRAVFSVAAFACLSWALVLHGRA